LVFATASDAGPLSGPAQPTGTKASNTQPGVASTTGVPAPGASLDDAERLAGEAGELYRQKKLREAVAAATRALELRRQPARIGGPGALRTGIALLGVTSGRSKELPCGSF